MYVLLTTWVFSSSFVYTESNKLQNVFHMLGILCFGYNLFIIF